MVSLLHGENDNADEHVLIVPRDALHLKDAQQRFQTLCLDSIVVSLFTNSEKRNSKGNAIHLSLLSLSLSPENCHFRYFARKVSGYDKETGPCQGSFQ